MRGPPTQATRTLPSTDLALCSSCSTLPDAGRQAQFGGARNWGWKFTDAGGAEKVYCNTHMEDSSVWQAMSTKVKAISDLMSASMSSRLDDLDLLGAWFENTRAPRPPHDLIGRVSSTAPWQLDSRTNFFNHWISYATAFLSPQRCEVACLSDSAVVNRQQPSQIAASNVQMSGGRSPESSQSEEE